MSYFFITFNLSPYLYHLFSTPTFLIKKDFYFNYWAPFADYFILYLSLHFFMTILFLHYFIDFKKLQLLIDFISNIPPSAWAELISLKPIVLVLIKLLAHHKRSRVHSVFHFSNSHYNTFQK